MVTRLIRNTTHITFLTPSTYFGLNKGEIKFYMLGGACLYANKSINQKEKKTSRIKEENLTGVLYLNIL